MKQKINRNKSFLIRMNEDEFNKLNSIVKESGYSREAYIRLILSGLQPLPMPSSELIEVIKQLRLIGNSMNQIATIGHSTGDLNIEEYKTNFIELKKVIDELMILIRKPLRLEEIYGDNKDMANKL